MILHEVFDKHNDEYLKFGKIENQLSSRPDIHAFILLNNIIPGDNDIIQAAEHDEYYLRIDLDKLQKVITEDQVIDLIRCGVRHSIEHNCLCLFT